MPYFASETTVTAFGSSQSSNEALLDKIDIVCIFIQSRQYKR